MWQLLLSNSFLISCKDSLLTAAKLDFLIHLKEIRNNS